MWKASVLFVLNMCALTRNHVILFLSLLWTGQNRSVPILIPISISTNLLLSSLSFQRDKIMHFRIFIVFRILIGLFQSCGVVMQFGHSYIYILVVNPSKGSVKKITLGRYMHIKKYQSDLQKYRTTCLILYKNSDIRTSREESHVHTLCASGFCVKGEMATKSL